MKKFNKTFFNRRSAVSFATIFDNTYTILHTKFNEMSLKTAVLAIVFSAAASALSAQNDTHSPATTINPSEHATNPSTEGHLNAAHDACSPEEESKTKYDPVPAVMHHIGDANQFHIVGNLHFPLPIFAYDTEGGLTAGLSTMFHDGERAVNGFVLAHDVLKKAKGLPKGELELEVVHTDESGAKHYAFSKEEALPNGKKQDVYFVKYQGQCYELEESRKLTNKASWIDFSITKNVFTMLFAFGLIAWLFSKTANYYKNNKGKAPNGLVNLAEVFVVFIRDEVAKPSIGDKYEKYMSLLLSLFFFILFNNLLGLIPFFPFGSNVMGNISMTIVLALIIFFTVLFNGNKNYWKHIFWMPDVPIAIKVLMMPIEVMSIFVKPFTLLIRLFANVTAGHVIILTFVSLIFVFGNAGHSLAGSAAGMLVAVPFTAFMNLLELLVAFLQAFIFTLLSAIYIGAAIEEHHHDAAHAHEPEERFV